MKNLIVIGMGGFFGAISRYLVGGAVYRLFGSALPYGTLSVNLLGSFLLGCLMELSVRSVLIPSEARMAIGVGFLGALTTFSTFSYETYRLFEDGAVMFAVINITLNLFLTLAAVFVGIALARTI